MKTPQLLTIAQPVANETHLKLSGLLLVNAYVQGMNGVDWSHIDLALEYALKAFGLPENYVDPNVAEVAPEEPETVAPVEALKAFYREHCGND